MPSTDNRQHVEYLVTVQPRGTERSYMLSKRYSQFYNLKSEVCRYSHELGDPLDQDFVDDRMSSFFFGAGEETYYARQNMLDKWLRYICLNGMAMSHPMVNAAVLDFLQFKTYVTRLPVRVAKADAPIQLMCVCMLTA